MTVVTGTSLINCVLRRSNVLILSILSVWTCWSQVLVYITMDTHGLQDDLCTLKLFHSTRCDTCVFLIWHALDIMSFLTLSHLHTGCSHSLLSCVLLLSKGPLQGHASHAFPVDTLPVDPAHMESLGHRKDFKIYFCRFELQGSKASRSRPPMAANHSSLPSLSSLPVSFRSFKKYRRLTHTDMNPRNGPRLLKTVVALARCSRCWIAKVAEPLAWYCPYMHLAASCNTVSLTESESTLHLSCRPAARVFHFFQIRATDFECFLRWGKKSCQSCKHPSRRTSKGARPAEFHLPTLAKTCMVSIPFVGIYRHLSAVIIQDLGGNVLYLARLSAWCNGSWTWALSSGPET